MVGPVTATGTTGSTSALGVASTSVNDNLLTELTICASMSRTGGARSVSGVATMASGSTGCCLGGSTLSVRIVVPAVARASGANAVHSHMADVT